MAGGRVRFCSNAGRDACNWLIPAESADAFCAACAHNRTIPDLSDVANEARWRRLESAKHRLFYTLLRFRLPLPRRPADPHGLVFDFLSDPPTGGSPPVMTGHDSGLITINVAEADDAEREGRRAAMGELYRTLLGHFRHEVGHFFWERLVRDRGRLDGFRALFGDERRDYRQALDAHYANGAPADWQARHVSSYASSHPWEDWAETWAHYLHIVDTLETARAFGLQVRPQIGPGSGSDPALHATIDGDPYLAHRIETLIDDWLPLTFAVNSLNRSMGQPDLYPFVLSPPAIEKLGYVHATIRGTAA